MSLGPCVGFGSIMIIEDTICYEVHDSRILLVTGQTFNFDTILWLSGQISLHEKCKQIAEVTEICNLGFRGYLRLFLSIYKMHSVKTCDYNIVIPVKQ